MGVVDLDQLHRERLSPIMKQQAVPAASEIFVSEKVVSSLPQDKMLVGSFDKERILALLPFTPRVFVEVCPHCLAKAELPTFEALVRAELIIPVLTAPYAAYGELADVLVARDHVSYFEYRAYRTATLMYQTGRGLCAHCVGKLHKAILRSTRKIEELEKFRHFSDVIERNLHPYLFPDYELLEQAITACKAKDDVSLLQLSNLSFVVRRLRTSQAFNAATIVEKKQLTGLGPKSALAACSDEAGYALLAAEGLGLRIPTDIPIERYIEIVKDYQPAITKSVKHVLDLSKSESDGKSLGHLSRQLMKINGEIERVNGLRRYKFLEACVDFYRNKKGVLATTLLASAFGLAGNAMGCVASLTGAAAVKVAKKLGSKQKVNHPARRLGDMLARDLQPHIDKTVACYVGAETATINVLSLRKRTSQRA